MERIFVIKEKGINIGTMISNTVLYTLKYAEGVDLMLSALTTKRGKKTKLGEENFSR